MVLVANSEIDPEGISDQIGSDDLNNEAIVQKLLQDTIQHLYSSTDPNGFTDLKEVIKMHFDAALMEFSKMTGTADADKCGMYKGLLIAQLKSVFRKFCLDFQNKQAENLSKAVQKFRTLVEGQIESDGKPPKKLQQILNNVRVEILSEINCNLFPDLYVQLNGLLDKEILDFVSENNRRLSGPDSAFNSVLPDLLEQCTEYLEMMLPAEELESVSERKFDSTFDKCQMKILQKLNEQMRFDNQELKEMYESSLTAHLQSQFSDKIHLAMIKRDKKLAEAASIVSDALTSFSKSISAVVEENSDDCVIEKYQEDETKTVVASLTSHIYKVLRDHTLAERTLEHAKQKMESIVQEIREQREAQEEKIKNRWEIEVNSIIAEFIVRFSVQLESKILPDSKQMQSNRISLVKDLSQKVDFSWMSGCGKGEELRTEFFKDVEHRIMNSSMSIMEKHLKMLDDMLAHQQIRTKECLEKHKLKLAELLKEDVNNEVIETAKALGNDAVIKFQKQVENASQSCISVTERTTSELKQAITKMNEEFVKQVRDRKLMIKAEISQVVDATMNDYRPLINSLSIATNYEKEKICQIHEILKDQAENSLRLRLKLAKYTGNHQEVQKYLNIKIENIYKQTLSTIDSQHCEWKKKLESGHEKATNRYIQQFTSSMGNVPNEDELQRIHTNLKKETIDIWEQSFPMDCCADKILYERHKISNSLENTFSTTICEKWKQHNLDIDRSAKESVERVVKKYERDMKSTLNSFDCLCADMIKSSHTKCTAVAKNDLKNVAKPKNVDNKIYMDLLNSRLDSTLDCFLKENLRKQHDITMGISNKIRQMKEMFMRDALRFTELPKITDAVGRYTKEVTSILDLHKTTPEYKTELSNFAREKLAETLNEVYEEWDNEEVDPNELQLCIYKAVEKYNKEMENRTLKTGQVFESCAIAVFHEKALAAVLKDFKSEVRQTSASVKKLNNDIDDAFKKYQELNNIKIADHFGAAIGIDLGTTFSCVAIYTGGKIEMIPDREHHSNTVPSYVFYENPTKTVVGHSAKDLSVIHPRETIFDSKRLIGRKFIDSDIQKDIAQWPFRVVPDPAPFRKHLPNIKMYWQTFQPEEISGQILQHLKHNAEKHLGREVKDVVITVPANFNDAQKRATKSAAAFANINVMEIINEPTAAAIAYSLNYTDGKCKNILVFDLGGGTFDVSIMTSEKCNLNVRAVGGHNHLGGEDFDSNMVDFCIEKFRQETGFVIQKNALNPTTKRATKDVSAKSFEQLRRLRAKCEQAKINLSKADKVRVVVDYIHEMSSLDVEITIQDFNDMNSHLFDECIQIVDKTVDESKLARTEIDDVILVGGSSRIPEVQRRLTKYFDGKSLTMTINPDEVVAQGAAYRAAILSGSNSTELKGIQFQDVNPLSLGIEVIGKRFSIIIPKNTPLPTKMTETYYTTVDFQTTMRIAIYEGEGLRVEENNLLGEFRLVDIPSKRQAKEPIDVTIECDTEGLLHVTAVVRSNDRSENIKINSNRGNLTEEDIQAIKAKRKNSSK